MKGMGSRAVFLDRDGVINEIVFREGRVGSPRSLEEFHFAEGVFSGLEALKAEGYRLFIVSNQPEVARGLLPLQSLNKITKKVLAELPVERALACVHDDADGCPCRKPKPGMLRQIAAEEGIDLALSFIVGDSWKDIRAGAEAGCRTLLLRRSYHPGDGAHDAVASLPAAVPTTTEGRKTGVQTTSYVTSYLDEVGEISQKISREAVEKIITGLVALRAGGGRLFFLGVGGSAGNASHAVNDFRKIAGMESYTPTDNVSELTARINDDGWDSSYANWLKGSRIGPKDAVFVFSVGGGHQKKRISVNLVEAIRTAKKAGAKVYGVVGRDGGYTAEVADACVVIPTVNPSTVTPHAEAFQAVVWHLIVSHPALLVNEMKWESVK